MALVAAGGLPSEVAASLRAHMPGARLLVRYADAGEDLLRERLAGWPLSVEEWVLESPDGDKMVELLHGGDISEVCVLGPGGKAPRAVRAPRYRFRQALTARELRARIIESRQMVREVLGDAEMTRQRFFADPAGSGVLRRGTFLGWFAALLEGGDGVKPRGAVEDDLEDDEPLPGDEEA